MHQSLRTFRRQSSVRPRCKAQPLYRQQTSGNSGRCMLELGDGLEVGTGDQPEP